VAIGLLAASLGVLGLSACDVASSSAVPPCRAVRITAGQFGVGHGHFGGALLFWNEGRVTCTVRGYPRVETIPATGGGPEAIAHTPRGYLGGLLPGTTRIPVVTLAPSGVAAAILEGSVAPPASAARCPRYGALRVGLPGARTTTTLAIETAGCSHLQVHPIVVGTTGDESP